MRNYLCENHWRIFDNLEPPNQDQIDVKKSLFFHFASPVFLGAAYRFVADEVTMVQSLIHSAKYNSMMQLARLLGVHTALHISSELQKYDMIIPVPLHPTRFAERGYNQAELIAEGFSKRTGVKLERKLLKRVKQTPSQTGLNAEKREENVRDAFRLSKKAEDIITGKRVLIIDDVMTTGATLASAASELDKAKPKSIGVIAVSAVTNN